MAGTARFYDGTVGESWEVTLQFGPGVLAIVHAPTGKEIVRWPFAEIELTGDRDAEPFLRLRRRGSVERLVIDDPGLRAGMARLDPRFAPLARTAQPVAQRLAAWGAALAILLGFAWTLVQHAPDYLAPMLPHDAQVAIGDDVYEEFAGDYRQCTSPAGLAALAAIMKPLEEAAKYGHPIRVSVVQHPMVNAFALPGGRLVLFSKLIDEAAGPHEVAAVIAHEIGHVVRYHSMKQLLRHYGTDLLMKIVTGGVSGSVANVVSAAELLLILRNGREAEREADTVALELMAKVGWRQDGLAEFFGRLMKDPGGDAARRAGIFSSHPPTDERILATKRAPDGAMPLSDAEWKALRAICR